MKIDIETPTDFAVEEFRLLDIGAAASLIVNFCLIENRKIGMELLGETRHVGARLVRAVCPSVLGEEVGETIELGGSMGQLRVASLSAINESALELIGGPTNNESGEIE